VELMDYQEIEERYQKGELFAPDSFDALRKMMQDPSTVNYFK
jgi:hypothetical protein